MFKCFAAALLFLGTGMSCFGHEIPKKVQLPGFVLDSSFAYICSGDIHLLLKDYEFALADFDRASHCIEYFGDYNIGYDFLILFGKTVAYDNLNLRDKCEHSLASLILTFDKIQKDDEIDEDEEEDEEEEEGLEVDEDFSEKTINMMRRIAELAPSEDVREVLISIVNEIDSE